MQRLAIIGITLVLSACASRPEPGSLAALKAQAEQKAIEHCLKSSIRKYPNVPVFDIWDTCHRAVLNEPQLIQRVKN